MIPDSIVQAIARAIATAEGFFVSGSLAQRANNPGNLKLGDLGFGTINEKTVFGTLQAGWDALYRQIRLMLTGASAYYKPEMTLSQVAVIYTGSDNPTGWARNVATVLGVTVDTTLADLLRGAGAAASSNPGTTTALILLGLAALLLLTD